MNFKTICNLVVHLMSSLIIIRDTESTNIAIYLLLTVEKQPAIPRVKVKSLWKMTIGGGVGEIYAKSQSSHS